MVWIAVSVLAWLAWLGVMTADELARQYEQSQEALELVDVWELVPPCLA